MVSQVKTLPNYTHIKGPISKHWMKRLEYVPRIKGDCAFFSWFSAAVSFCDSGPRASNLLPFCSHKSPQHVPEHLKEFGRQRRRGLSWALLPLCLCSPPLTEANDFLTSFLIRINREVSFLSLKLLLIVKSPSSGIAETE